MFELRDSKDTPSNPSHSVNFDFGSESNVDTAGFNPLHQFDHIGKRKLDQVCHICFMVAIYFNNVIHYIF